MYDRFAQAILAAVLILLPLTVGCSLVGLGLGAASSTKTETLTGWEFASIEPGKKVTLSMNYGIEVSGKYRGSSIDTNAGYKERYDLWMTRREDDLWFPDLTSPVILSSVSGENIAGTFHGFDYGRIYVGSTTHATLWDLAEVMSISDSTGGAISGVRLIEETMRGSVPFWSNYLIETGGAPVEFQLQEVESVVVHGQNNAATGFLVGLAIDGALLYAAAKAAEEFGRGLSNMDFNSGSSSGSCPFVYSYNGEDYVFDAEPLGGLFFEGAARSDFVRLNHLQASNGEYRLRVATELDETDYIDAVKLHVVDHPEGSELVPTFDGRMLALTDPVRPHKAITHGGWDALGAVRERDGRFWTSNPFNRNPNDPSQLRDGMELEFPRPEGAQIATLAMTVKNLEWTDHIAGDVFRLAGEDLNAWYDRLNKDPKERGAFLGTVVREVLLRVEVWSGTEWLPSGSILAMGPRVETDRALQIRLPDSNEAVTRIRLSAMAGMWMIDRAVIDYGASEARKVQIVHPREAIDHKGRDVLGSIEATDGKYHEMPEIGYHVNVAFDAPPLPAAGFSRSVIVEASGYYKIHIDPRGHPDFELIQKIMAKPGALSQWVLTEFNNDASNALASHRK